MSGCKAFTLTRLAGAAAVLLALSSAAQAADDFRVTYAGSMGVVMDKALGPAFARENKVNYQGQGQGAYGMANLLASKKVVADVFVSVTPGPIAVLQKAGLVDHAVPVASTSMVIAWNPKGKYAAQFNAIRDHQQGAKAWWQVLQTPSLRFGRTDPATDPQGQNIIFTMLLASRYYQQPDLANKVLGDVQNPQQVFAEGGLLTRLEAGQIDAASGYESATRSAHLPYITLPDEINLSDPSLDKEWYSRVSFDITDAKGQKKTLHTQPLVFYAAVLKNAPHPEMAQKFVQFMQGKEGQTLLQNHGYGAPKGGAM
ncbi:MULTISPECIES: extracellular solute-binding protein [Erwinia]|uniref:ABC transporter substrate-binding protein n=2 Tax=Erwinia TaxID=551 RepID=A0A014PXE0_9GAMM|nr:extracellular solute-binding protein [Erwinia mallotivora]EXU75612.1 ABC transporter substrate-binding protein [Erwinia mallotivora]